MAQKKRCRVATSSKYFEVETPPSKASNLIKATSSRYFLHSPSSAIGSVRSMPSFLRALVSLEEEKTIELEEGTCSCQCLAQVASDAQFAHCPIFQEARQSNAKQKKERSSCCDEQTLDFHRSICHLCPHACYLRAFAPLREWHYLRASCAEISESSPGTWVQSLLLPLRSPKRLAQHGTIS